MSICLITRFLSFTSCLRCMNNFYRWTNLLELNNFYSKISRDYHKIFKRRCYRVLFTSSLLLNNHVFNLHPHCVQNYILYEKERKKERKRKKKMRKRKKKKMNRSRYIHINVQYYLHDSKRSKKKEGKRKNLYQIMSNIINVMAL